jgi:hypothetical protein
VRAGRAAALLAIGALALGAASSGPPVGGLTALPAQDAAGPNLLTNGGFETRAGDAPSGWTLRAEPGGWALDAAGRSGSALRMSGTPGARVIPGAEQAVALEPGHYTLEAWVKARAVGAGAPRSGVRLCLDGRPGVQWWKCTPLVDGTRDWAAVQQKLLTVTVAGTYRVTAGAYGTPDGTAWFDDVSLTRAGGPPLDVFLLYPNYRGMLFADRSQTVRARVTVGDGVGRAGGDGVRVTLLDEATGSARARRELPAAPGSTLVELDASGLGPGGGLLRAEVTRGGEAVQRHPDYRIVRVPAAAREKFAAWYDERNVIHLQGRPAFVLGLYTTGGYSSSPAAYARGGDGWGTAKMAQAPINMLINYWLGRAPIPALEAYMDDLASRGISYLHTVNFFHAEDPQFAKIEYPAAREGEEALNRWIARTLGAHRGLAGFYTMDERPAEFVPRVFRQQRALAAGAPGTVTYGVLGDGWETQAPLWRDAVDVLGLDPYPITRPPGQNDLAMVGEWTRLARAAVQGSRPVWMVLQYFPLTAAGGWPRFEDLRAMSWMAIVEGAQGLLYWSYGTKGLAWVKDPAQREQRWQELVRITREIKGYEPVLLSPDVRVVADEPAGVRALGKRGSDGARYLFAYNRGNTARTVTWTLAEPAREAFDLAAARPVALPEPGRLTLPLAPYEVKQLRLR